jgi:hypothetical protein
MQGARAGEVKIVGPEILVKLLFFAAAENSGF